MAPVPTIPTRIPLLWHGAMKSKRLYAFRNREPGPVSAISVPQKAVGFVVAGHLFGRRIEVESATQAIGNVREVHQGAGIVPFLDRRGEVFFLPAAHAIDEVGEVIFRRATARTRLALLTQPGFIGIVLLNAQVAFRPIKQVTDGGRFSGGRTKHLARGGGRVGRRGSRAGWGKAAAPVQSRADFG